MHQALYRKWRSKTFADVVGQEHITRTLKNEVAAGKFSHAYLFCGTRGTGKTTCSKILARAVNCPNQAGGDPCCECDICKGIEDGSILDVTEIDAASNSGVDNIRDLREEAFFTPTVCKYRVYIIDETHMLSAGAFNALLKIMEEPPAHVIFILATTEIHKVPSTVISRCERFDFHRIPSSVIADRLMHIAQNEEDFTLEPEAAELIARLADGGMRDAISLLDLCVSASFDVTAQTVRNCAGLVGQGYLFEIGEAVKSADPGSVLASLEGLWERGSDYQRLCEQLIGFYRNIMVAKSVREPADLISCLPDELERYKTIAGKTDMPEIMRCLDVLQDALIRMSRVSAKRAELEMALLKLSAEKKQSESAPDPILVRIEALENKLKSGFPVPSPLRSGISKSDPMPDSEEIKKTPVSPFGEWDKVLAVLKDKNKALYGALVDSKAYYGGDLLLIDAGDLFAKLVRSDEYAKESLREAVLSVTGKRYGLGPYNPKKFEATESELKLDQLLVKASELGVNVKDA